MSISPPSLPQLPTPVLSPAAPSLRPRAPRSAACESASTHHTHTPLKPGTRTQSPSSTPGKRQRSMGDANVSPRDASREERRAPAAPSPGRGALALACSPHPSSPLTPSLSLSHRHPHLSQARGGGGGKDDTMGILMR